LAAGAGRGLGLAVGRGGFWRSRRREVEKRTARMGCWRGRPERSPEHWLGGGRWKTSSSRGPKPLERDAIGGGRTDQLSVVELVVVCQDRCGMPNGSADGGAQIFGDAEPSIDATGVFEMRHSPREVPHMPPFTAALRYLSHTLKLELQHFPQRTSSVGFQDEVNILETYLLQKLLDHLYHSTLTFPQPSPKGS
jgi:hypothetical protein